MGAGALMRAALSAGIVLLLALPSLLSAEIYRWTDSDGRVHFTQDLSRVPPAHRAQADEQFGPERWCKP